MTPEETTGSFLPMVLPESASVREALAAGVNSGVTPAATLCFGDGDNLAGAVALGTLCTDSCAEKLVPAKLESTEEVELDTVFDVASVTKPVTTSAVLMRLLADGRVALDDPLRKFIPEATVRGAETITLRHLMGHASGYPAHVEFFRPLLAGERAGSDDVREAILRMAASTPLAYQPGDRAIYSDLGFILLAFCLERATGERLDALTKRLITEPLAMGTSGFVDLLAAPPALRPAPVAATEVCPYRGLVAGEVHDDNCHAAGGVLGHAGLFSTAPDLSRFAVAINRAARGERGLFDPDVVALCLATSAAPDTSWRLGWDRPAPLPAVSHAGDLWPRSGYGHLGFTGCSLWLDPPRGRYVVLLANRVHPSREKKGILEVRRSVMDAVVRQLNAS